MSQLEDVAPDETPITDTLATAFVPPSVSPDTLLSGESYEHYSPVPPSLLSNSQSSSSPSPAISDAVGVPCCLGIDEAGRGPVLGPMVYGAFYLPIALSTPLLSATHHFDDSKVLTPEFRAQLMQKLCTGPTPASETPDPVSLYDNCGWAVSVLSARSISAGMLQPAATYNLNAQAMDATISLIRNIYALGVNVREIYIDTIGQPAPYQAKLQKIFPTASIVVAKKADSLYPCVSAASVCAKVTRDVALEVLYEQSWAASNDDADATGAPPAPEADWGSGYPSDARCTTWMKRNMDPIFGWGTEARFSWGTAKDMLEVKGAAASVAWPTIEDDDVSHMTDYFGAGKGSSKGGIADWYGDRVGMDVF